MFKLLVDDTVSGMQKIIEVTLTGKYYDDSKVLWDERIHGPIPVANNVGGYKVDMSSGSRVLVLDQKKLDAFKAKESELQAKEVQTKAMWDRIKTLSDNEPPGLLKDIATALLMRK